MYSIDRKHRELGAACIVAAIVTRSLEVESFRSIVERYYEFKANLDINNDLDYLAALLLSGHFSEIKTGMHRPEIVNSNLTAIKNHLIQRIGQPIVGDNETGIQLLAEVYNVTRRDFASAYLSAAFIEHTSIIETSSQIAGLWDKIRNTIAVEDAHHQISALLLAGRIRDFKTEQDIFNVIDMNYGKLAEMLRIEYPSTTNHMNPVIAYLVGAYLRGTDKLESLKEIIRLYVDFNRDINLVSEKDVLATILLTGKLKKITKFLTINDINDLIGGIKQLLDN